VRMATIREPDRHPMFCIPAPSASPQRNLLDVFPSGRYSRPFSFRNYLASMSLLGRNPLRQGSFSAPLPGFVPPSISNSAPKHGPCCGQRQAASQELVGDIDVVITACRLEQIVDQVGPFLVLFDES